MITATDIAYQYTKICILSGWHVWLLTTKCQHSIDASQQAERRRLFITRRTEKLAGKEKPAEVSALEVAPDLEWSDDVVLDSVTVT
jgi:hypothetical protein